MSIDEIRKFLEKQQDGKGYLEALNDYLNTLATASKADKDNIKKLNEEAKKHKADMAALTGKIEKFADALGVSEESETLDDDIAAALKTKGGTGDAALQKKIDRLTRQLADKTKELTEQLTAERGKRHESMIKNALLSELTAQNAVDPSTLVDMFRGSVKVAEDDTLTFGEDGKSVKDGVSAWLQAHPVFVSNKQKAGAGGGNNSGSGGEDKLVDMAKALGKNAAHPSDDPAAVYFK